MSLTRYAVILLAVGGWLGLGGQATAQLPAFPGAEGVAKYITGGRGGDVYHVTNLNDSGTGSLRYGIQNAPTTGRTIVFDVGGTINLASSLDFNGKDNITIAGQTAPGGGITLAGNRLRINPLFDDDDVVDPLNNVIVQFLRVRPGAAADNADGVWVQTANNVIIDHVNTSWCTDESISSTHESNNVTVQWSTMTQGIVGHSYGSLLNGQMYTYAHNLYVHNESRNPRLQQASGDSIMDLDFVNNVIYDPKDKFAYGKGPYNVNMVGNYGIRGPDTNDTNRALIRDTDTSSAFWLEGNYMDTDTDGEINGILAPLEGDDHDPAIFRIDAPYTLLPSRVPVPESNVTSAEQAYVQVLSRAGATNYRDAHDRDMIRNVMNQQPGLVSNESEWGAYPTLPSGSAAPDANGDGVPDAWATANYGDTSTPLNTTYASSGYTYLEEYIHSLTPYAYAPTGTESHTITTAYGQGADAQVNENGGTSATSSGDGAGTTLSTVWGGTSGTTNEAIVLRFDLSEIEAGSVTEAALELTAAEAITGTHEFKLFGLEHDGADWDWDEATVEFDGAPGLQFDGNSRTLGIDPRYTADGQPAEQDNFPLDTPGLYALGEFSIGAMSAGQTVSFDGLDLAVMLNLAAYFEGEAQAGLVTLILEQTNATGTADATFWSSEAGASLAPRLVVDAVLASVAPLVGDYNDDGIVDAADYTVWRDSLGQSGSGLAADGDGDGTVDADDYDLWKAHYGESTGGGSLAGTATVPEPTGLALLVVGSLILLARRK